MEEIDTSEFTSIAHQQIKPEENPDFKPINVFNRYIIVDDFYANPDQIRNYALSVEKEEETNGNYAGKMTNSSFITQEHLQAFKDIIGQEVYPSTSLTGKFRFTSESDPLKQDIHFDPGDNNCCWAAVAYLTPNVEADGTYFWQHNKTGLTEIPRTLEGIQQYGWNDTDDLKVFLETEGCDHSLWKKTLTIPYKYNRLVLFRPWLFHSPGPAFGTTPEDNRLIQTFFFGTLEKPL